MQAEAVTRFEATRAVIERTERDRPVVVITDSGDRAKLVLYPPGTGLSVGQALLVAGSAWQVVGWRPSARAWIARPRHH